MNIVLWILQILLALLFLFAGVTKFLIPADEMAKNMPPFLSTGFIYFVGVCEILGAIGLVVPWATKIKPWLTPLAAALLAVLMIGAVVVSPKEPSIAFPGVVALLCIFIAWGRRRPA